MNPLYDDIRYNNKTRYNVNSVCTKISRSSNFSLTAPCYSLGKHTYLLESPRRGDSNKYTKRMIYKKKTVQKYCYLCFGRVHFKFLYNSKFDYTAKSLATNTVVITRFLCTYYSKCAKDHFYIDHGQETSQSSIYLSDKQNRIILKACISL